MPQKYRKKSIAVLEECIVKLEKEIKDLKIYRYEENLFFLHIDESEKKSHSIKLKVDECECEFCGNDMIEEKQIKPIYLSCTCGNFKIITE